MSLRRNYSLISEKVSICGYVENMPPLNNHFDVLHSHEQIFAARGCIRQHGWFCHIVNIPILPPAIEL